ncbi:hypothetical protein U2069_14875, partial [Listeria monocytogenes]|uniref:hypothetical protein n=1 Tax=Listeria monocytogenes TaxID=1639 RepID=UPI002FDBF98D
ATTLNQPYLLCNLRGQGYPFRDVRAKILRAWRDVMPRQWVVDEYSAVTDGTWNLAVPAQWREITGLATRAASSQLWEDYAPQYFDFDA